MRLMMFKKRSVQFILFVTTLCISSLVFAEQTPTLGQIAEKLIAGTDVLTRLMHVVCFVMGVGLFIVAITMYMNHRNNPKFVPLDRAVMFVVLGVLLVSIPFLGHLFGPTGSSIDYKRKDKEQQVVKINNIDMPLNNTANNSRNSAKIGVGYNIDAPLVQNP